MNKIPIIIFVLLLIIPFVSSAAPITQVGLTAEIPSITIVYPTHSFAPVDSEPLLSFDVLNSSYAKLDNTTTTCDFAMIDHLGTLITGGSLVYNQTLGYWNYQLNSTHTAVAEHYSYYVHCNQSGEYFGFVTENIDVLNGDDPLESFDNYSFPSIILVFIFLTTIILVSMFVTKKNWVKAVLLIALSLSLTSLMRFSAWFVEITNPNEIVLIDTLNFFYSIGVRSMYFIVAGVLLFLVVFILNSIRSRPDRKRKESWDNWGDDDE